MLMVDMPSPITFLPPPPPKGAGERPKPHPLEMSYSYKSSTIGHRPSVIGHRSSTIGHRPSVIGHRPSAIDHRSPAIRPQPPCQLIFPLACSKLFLPQFTMFNNKPAMLTLLACFMLLLNAGCKKHSVEPTPVVNPPVIVQPVDPPVANSIDFFLEDWVAKSFTVPSFTDTSILVNASQVITIDPATVITKIPASIFGNNANPYMTQIVTEPVLLNHISQLHPHIIRFPGGNLSSLFFWNAAWNSPPADAPATQLNAEGAEQPAGYWYGRNSMSWTLSIDNYYEMLRQTGNQGMITINYGYARYGTGANPVAAAAHLAAEWVRYDKGRTRYWEIGNESNGTWQAGYRINTKSNKDGQPEFITGELYGNHFKVFADSMRKAAAENGKQIFIGAQLLERAAEPWQTATDKTWNRGVYSAAANMPDFYIVHSYFTPYNTNSNANDILNSAVRVPKEMIEYIKTNTSQSGITMKPLALTEWNIFAVNSMQMVSHINGMHSVITLGELIENKFGMAARWNLSNAWDNGNDHGTFNAGDEPGATKWNPRPVFYHMYFFKKFLGDRLVASSTTNTNIETYASSFSSGEAGVTLINKSGSAEAVQLHIKSFQQGERYYGYTLTGGSDNGEFSRKVVVNGKGPSGVSGGPADYTQLKPWSAKTAGNISLILPARTVVCIVVERKK
jgi:hypothetical protein